MPEPISVENITRQQFEQELQPMGKPFIIRNFAADWDIVATAKHSPANMLTYLYEKGADPTSKILTTRIDTTQKSRMFYNSDMSGMNFGVADLPLKNTFERMSKDTHQADYAAQCVSLAKYFPSINRAIKNDLIDAEINPFIWFGNKVVVAPHFDENDNIAVVVAGKRRFTLFPPQQTKNLYIGPLDYNPAGQAISLVDILAPDLEMHPRYAEAYQHGLSAELAPGDAIYIPTPWWHHVQSLSNFNILINYWWNQHDFGTGKPMGAILHAIQAFKGLPAPQRDAFKALMDYYVFADPELAKAHIPLHVQGWLGELTHEQRKSLEHWIKTFSQ